MVIVDKKKEILESSSKLSLSESSSSSSPTSQQQMQNSHENIETTTAVRNDEDSLSYDEYNHENDQLSAIKTKRLRPIESKNKEESTEVNSNAKISKYRKMDSENLNLLKKIEQINNSLTTMKESGINEDLLINNSNNINQENLLLLKKVYAKYTDEIQNMMYAPVSPALTINSDKSPLHHHDSLMVMHHFNEEHTLSSSGLSSSSSSLLRTSSNASSSSSASSTNTNNTNSTTDNSSSTNVSSQSSESSPFLIPAANQLLMLNESFKKLISTLPQNENGISPDQLALMMRSRSSSAESSYQQQQQQQQQQMINLFQIQNNLRNGELDNVLLSKYFNSVTRPYTNNSQKIKLQSPQQSANYYNSNQDQLSEMLLMKQITNPCKLAKIDENYNAETSSTPPPLPPPPPPPPPPQLQTNQNKQNPSNQTTLMTQMLNTFNSTASTNCKTLINGSKTEFN